jgi:hypothetical protein
MEGFMKRYEVIIITAVWNEEEPSIEEAKEILSDLCGQNIDNIMGPSAYYEIGGGARRRLNYKRFSKHPSESLEPRKNT